MKRTLPFAIVALSLAQSFIDAPQALAATMKWNPTQVDSVWTNSANWVDGLMPGTADTANIGNNADIHVYTDLPSFAYLVLGGGTSATMAKLTIHQGGTLNVTGSGRTRLGDKNGGTTAALIVDGGTLNSVGRIAIGVIKANVNATMTVKNGGVVNASVVGLGHDQQTTQTTVLNIGGEGVAEAVGWLNVNSIEGSTKAGDPASNSNTLNFNHTSNRYLFSKAQTDSTAIVINSFTKVDVKAGVTVLAGASSYTEGTTVRNGAVLLANSQDTTAGTSSVGTGAVLVESGGVLGGIGRVGGATVIEGTLKPGDYDYDAAVPTHGVLSFLDDVTFSAESLTLIAIQGAGRGTGYDAIDVAGNVSFDGTLQVVLQLGFTIAAGETAIFDIFNVAGTNAGNYSAVTLPSTWDGLDLVWDRSLLSTTGELSVTAVAAVPEASSFVLFGLGLGGLALISRRRSLLTTAR